MTTLLEFSSTLKDMYRNAPHGDQVAMIHLFGIKYAIEIKNAECSLKEILQSAGMNLSYATEISKGIKLAKYVTIK